jgi:hypothetical protein
MGWIAVHAQYKVTREQDPAFRQVVEDLVNALCHEAATDMEQFTLAMSQAHTPLASMPPLFNAPFKDPTARPVSSLSLVPSTRSDDTQAPLD